MSNYRRFNEDYAVPTKELDDEGFYTTLEQHYQYYGQAPQPHVDIIKSPDHYAKWAIEPATFIMKNHFEFWRGNIIKYASRAGYKKYDNKDMRQSEITDLQKIIRYAEMRIEQLEAEE